MYETGSDGLPVVTGLKVGPAGKEKVIKADAYVAALDVPGAQRLVPKPWRSMEVSDPALHCCWMCCADVLPCAAGRQSSAAPPVHCSSQAPCCQHDCIQRQLCAGCAWGCASPNTYVLPLRLLPE
jgi:hypothetical protein